MFRADCLHCPRSSGARCGWLLAVAAALVLTASGCGRKDAAPPNPVSQKPKVRVVHPETRSIVRTIGQPSFVDAYEQTSVYAKLPGYIEKWEADIGHPLRKDQLLATLFIPELIEEHREKQEEVGLARVLVEQARKTADAAEGNWKAAVSQVAEAKAAVLRCQADVDRWDSEAKRLGDLVKQKVVDQQVLDESVRQLRSHLAACDAARATVETAQAAALARAADFEKAKVDIRASQSRLKVAEAAEKRLAALVGYTRLTAPFNGIVVARNANTGDFVRPAQGDSSAGEHTFNASAGKPTPIFVVARTDVVRVYIDIPEDNAVHVVSWERLYSEMIPWAVLPAAAPSPVLPRIAAFVSAMNTATLPLTPATVRIPAYHDHEIAAHVTRTSWALNVKSRTLRAEIDLLNHRADLRPGMYAYSTVSVTRHQVRALPLAAVVEIDNDKACWFLRDGKATRVPVRVGLNDGTWVEILKKKIDNRWIHWTGAEAVILADPSELSEGGEVEVAAPE